MQAIPLTVDGGSMGGQHQRRPRGRETLVRFTDHVRSQGAKVTPICGVARAMMEDDERHEDVLHSAR
jgi:hypothetical protein